MNKQHIVQIKENTMKMLTSIRKSKGSHKSQNKRVLPVFKIILIVTCVFLISNGCSKKSEKEDNSQIQNQELSEQLKAIRREIMELRSACNEYQQAEFNPTEAEGFSRLDSSVGTFLVSLGQIDPYLDGVKVSLRIGNLSSAVYKGFRLKIKWGMSREKYVGNVFDWLWSLNSRELRFTETLHAGRWNLIDFVLPNTNSKELGHISISIETDSVSLVK